MILTKKLANEISTYCQSLLTSGKELSIEDSNRFDVDYNVLNSIYRQILVRRVKNLSHQIDIKDIGTRVDRGESIYEIAIGLGFSPYKLAKMYVETVFGESFQLASLLRNVGGYSCSANLRYDLLRCISEDMSSSVEVELMKQCVGKEFEEILYSKLDELLICYEKETEMRKKGKSKTPDVLLLIPMAVYNETDKKYYVVNWIDSKGMFGDDDAYSEHVEQINGYVNRYGHGLVIYWYGYVEGLRDVAESVLVSDRFPTQWIFPTGETATGKSLSFDELLLSTDTGTDKRELDGVPTT